MSAKIATFPEPRGTRNSRPNAGICLPLYAGLDRRRHRRYGRLPDRPGQDQDAESEDRRLHRRAHVQEQLRLLQEGRPSRRRRRPLPRPCSPTHGCSPRKGYQAYGKIF